MVDGSIKIEPSFKAVVDEIDSSAVFNDGTYESKTANAESLKGVGFELFTIDDEGSEVYKLDNVLATVKKSDEGTVTYIYEEVRSVYLDYPETIHEEIVDEDPIDRPIPPTPTFPEINAVIITALSGLSEGDPSVMAGAVVARISVNGGTSPYTYKLTSGDDKFTLNGYQIKTKEALKEGNYEVSVSVIDKNGKTGTGTVSIVVKETNIKIDSVTINYSASTYEEKSEGTKAGATLATIKVEGGNKPYSYKISGNSSVEVDESGNIKAKSDLKAGDIKAKVTVTDADGDSADTEFNITVQSFKLVDVTKVVIPREQNGKTWNKKISDLQKADITVVSTGEGTGKITGTSKYAIDYQQPDSVDGNWVALHIDNTKLPLGEVKYVTEKGELDPDTKDWNFNIRLDNKKDKSFKIQVDGEILYTIDLKEIILEEKLKDITEVILTRKDSEMTFNKKIEELQKNIKVVKTGYGTGEMTGTLNYITGYTNPAYSEGNVVSFHIDNTKLPKGTVKIGIGDTFVDPDMNDWNVNIRLDSSKNREFKIKVDDEILYTLDLSKLVLLKDISTVITPRDGKLPTFNKKVEDLQLDDIVVKGSTFGKGEATGTIKYVTDYQTGGDTEGNFIALHVDNTKLPEGEVKFALDGKEASPDMNDWNANLRIDNKKDKTFKIKVNGEVLYELDLSKLTLLNSPDTVLKVLDQSHQMGNMPVSDIQTDVTVSKESEITGTLKYVKGLELSGDRKQPDGNYLCLHVEKAELPEGTITQGINNMKELTEGYDDVLLSITNESKQKPYKIAVDDKVLYEFDLSGLELSPDEEL